MVCERGKKRYKFFFVKGYGGADVELLTIAIIIQKQCDKVISNLLLMVAVHTMASKSLIEKNTNSSSQTIIKPL